MVIKAEKELLYGASGEPEGAAIMDDKPLLIAVGLSTRMGSPQTFATLPGRETIISTHPRAFASCLSCGGDTPYLAVQEFTVGDSENDRL